MALWCLAVLFAMGSCNGILGGSGHSKEEIRATFEEGIGIKLDIDHFEVLVDSVHHTEGALDLDYTWYVLLQLDSAYYGDFQRRALATGLFNRRSGSSLDPPSANSQTTDGRSWSGSVDHYHCPAKKLPSNMAEYLECSLDTVAMTLSMELIHI